MGAAHPFTLEKLVVGVLSSRPARLTEARSRLEGRFGPVDFASPEVPFGFTRYYDAEMGPGIVRLFWTFERLVDPTDFASIKLATNDIEDTLREDGRRKVNLDPGLLSLGRFMLATTKENAHRVPIGKGIFAEVTLVFERAGFRPLEWTYPDYRSAAYLAILNGIRSRHQAELGRRAAGSAGPCLPG